MKTGGVYLLLIGLTIVASSPQEKIYANSQAAFENGDLVFTPEKPKQPKCFNSTLFISLKSEGTQFRIESVENVELLFVNYSIPGHKDIFALVDAVFNSFFPVEEFITKSPFCDVEIIKKTYENGEVIRALIRDGDELLTLNSLESPKTLLKEVISCGRIKYAKVEVSPELGTDWKDEYNFTALHWAAFFNQSDEVRRLIGKGASPNSHGPMNVTPLKAAVATGNLDLVRFLVESGADVNSASYNGMVPVIVAVNAGRLEILRYLVQRGANLSATYSAVGSTPLHIAAEVGRVPIVRVLVEAGMDKDLRDRHGSTPLHKAARNSHLEVVRYLLDKGADVNARDNLGRTPLIIATDNRLTWDTALETIQLLIEKGADAKIRDRNGQSALSVLTVAQNEKIEQLLKSKGLLKH